ncbi:NDR1/HIN1-like protein 10 [Vicia villosa]|uniref:NDR1/HIN1-like protein 10 n=1 Tax=Vicia villosa TaxID=3911 RepID=UPI00273AD45D|nr:NDR1/HIN1-like protein 10 [Vicia villosa]
MDVEDENYCCCCNNIVTVICNLIIILLGLIAILFWLIIQPKAAKFTVTNASLTQFSFTNNNTLNYNLALDITIRNPNRKLGIYYDIIETLACYKDARFGFQTLGPFFQHHKSTDFMSPVFIGQQVISLSRDRISKFEKEKRDGVYGIDVKILMNVRFKLGLFKTGKAKPKVRCNLKVPLRSSNVTTLLGNKFQATDCEWDYKGILFR